MVPTSNTIHWYISGFKIALIQMAVGRNKAENIKKAVSMISDAKLKGSHLVVLPECFNSPYGTSEFNDLIFFIVYFYVVRLGPSRKQITFID